MKKILIDADTGVDDALGILFALKREDVQVVGITTGFGNTYAEQAAENTLRLIKMAKVPYEVPVAIGAKAPLVGEAGNPPFIIHGENGIGDVNLPETEQKPLEESAIDFIIRMANEHGRDLTIVTLGRMTNLALALEKEPNLPKMVKDVVFMGGTYQAPGNMSPHTEANIAGDPEAADLVLQGGFEITMVGLDATTKVRMRPLYFDALLQYAPKENQAIAKYLKESHQIYFDFNRISGNATDNVPLHDPLAVLLAIDPSFGTYKKRRARVECGGTFSRGMIVTDYREEPMDAKFLTICVDVDADEAIEKLFGAFMERIIVEW